MPGTFIFAIIFAVFTAALALAALALKGPAKNDDDLAGARAAALAGGGIFAALAVIMTLVSSYNPVGTRDIGIETSFGQPVGHLGPGFHLTAPWDTVTPIDDAYQLTDETFQVRIAGGQTAQATAQVRWQPAAGASDDIFGNYKTTAGLQSGLLDPELNVATNTVLDTYDPIAALASGAAAGTPANPSTAQLGAQIEAVLRGRVGTDINIATFNLKPLVYDAAVQAQINSATNQAAKTVVAQESEKTALAQAAANRDLETGLASDPLVLVQQCMTAIGSGEFKPPAGFSCWPGQGSGVVIPSASK